MLPNDLSPVPEFPTHVLPGAVGQLVRGAALSLGAPADFIALPMLAIVAGMIGNQRRIQLKPGYEQRAILWPFVVGVPGSMKTPAQQAVMDALNQLQRDAYDRYGFARTAYEAELSAWAATNKKDRGPEPKPPTMLHYYCADITLEALNAIHEHAPGFPVVRDEIVSWIKSLDAYRKAGDRQAYLSLWAGAPVKVDRKSGPPIYIPEPTVSITGGVQPDMLPLLAEEAGRRDGFIERILWAYPDAPPARWNDNQLDPDLTRAVAEVFTYLRFSGYSAQEIRLDPDAKREWTNWYDENSQIANGSSGLAQGFAAKLPNQCARLALVLHCLHHPQDSDQTLVDQQVMMDAIELAEYFRAHALRVLPFFGSQTDDISGLLPRIRRILKRHGGEWVTRTMIYNGLGGHVSADDISDVLDELLDIKVIEYQRVVGERGGRPTEQYRWVNGDTEQRNNVTTVETGVTHDDDYSHTMVCHICHALLTTQDEREAFTCAACQAVRS